MVKQAIYGVWKFLRLGLRKEERRRKMTYYCDMISRLDNITERVDVLLNEEQSE